ncbi:nuclear transport factor 2 family protein [Nocardia sp. NPDC058633]|uniref:nuclear transport factor 2 family protein n=1 Tax=Nocardia sp. NPDC058633 TaxID=3346568 RepID=UPI00364FB8A9
MTARDVAESLYAAFAESDGPALAGLLDRSFTARVSSGMPLGVGGSISDPQSMLSGVWGTVFAAYAAAPYPEEFVPVAPDRVIVFGFYRGTCRSTGTGFEAAFAHDLTVRDGKIVSLIQITDTEQWHAALSAG